MRYRGPEAELWGLGVLLYTMLFGENPFNNPKNTVSQTLSIKDLASTCGADVYIDGERLMPPVQYRGHGHGGHGGSSQLMHPHPHHQTTPDLMALQMQMVQVVEKRAEVRISRACWSLLERLLERQPGCRIGIGEVREHGWLLSSLSI
jgi:serine/threonine protein kinase